MPKRMTPTKANDPAQEERTKRDLRLRIGRLRRRIDSRLRASDRQARRLLSWRSYVRHWPGHSMVAALGVGLALSAGLSARRLSRWLGFRLIRRATDRATRELWRELERIWADSTPAKPAQNHGADDA
ncbi:MAG: hypothetical protein A2V70_16765 [Planctomycetes bacterium RBG_13_63_9]|nr:MAG: hypothetical protein A2V70_16765 [Planctomycetes bacterium RBG_13_63_9]